MPDAKTLYLEALAKDETAEALFDDACGARQKEQAYLEMSGQIVDATIMSVHTPEESAAIKAGETPRAGRPL